MDDIEYIKKELEIIKERNVRVEADKAWELSVTRTVSILVLTQIVSWVGFAMVGSEHAFMDALIPTFGFFLSIQSLPYLKRAWIRRYVSDKSDKKEEKPLLPEESSAGE
jgi:preprotein translocase subunit SecF